MLGKIAIILPVYQKDKVEFLRLSIDSILCQTYPDVHLYVGVDGPIDVELQECLAHYVHKFEINVVSFSENRGLAAVLNDLIGLCRKENYEFIARMDADDISMPDRLEKQMDFLLSHPDVDVVGGSIEEIDEKGNLRNKRVVYPLTADKCRHFFAYRNPLAHPAVLFRYRFFEKSGCLYRSEYKQNQDTLLWYDGLRNGCLMANIPDVVLYFRMTNSLFKKRRNGYAFARKSLKDRFMINRGLGYGIYADLFAIMMFLITVSPVWIKKIAYRLR